MTTSAREEFDIVQRWPKTAPVNVVGLANALGIKVWESRDLPTEISGKLVKSKRRGGKSGYAIFLNTFEGKARKRFTVAHEIGHFLLHRNYIGNGISDNTLYRSSALSNSKESEANGFAAELLMPMKEVKRLRNELHTIPEVAQRLGVSELALRIRLGVG